MYIIILQVRTTKMKMKDCESVFKMLEMYHAVPNFVLKGSEYEEAYLQVIALTENTGSGVNSFARKVKNTER